MTDNSKLGVPVLVFKNKIVIATKAIRHTDFDTLDDFARLAEKQGLGSIIVTQGAKEKLELLMQPK